MNAKNLFSGQAHRELVGQLFDCSITAESCASSCLQENDVLLMTRCIELDRDCSDICVQAARLLQRESELSHAFLVVCEEACRLCAEECRKHDTDHCRCCAQTCERMAEACHEHHGAIAFK